MFFGKEKKYELMLSTQIKFGKNAHVLSLGMSRKEIESFNSIILNKP
jgi:hypothetical protein